MIDTLIKMFTLAQDKPDVFCEGGIVGDKCAGVGCGECPFYSTPNLTATIDELKQAQEKQDA